MRGNLQSLTKSRFLFPSTLALIVLSALVCLSGIWRGVTVPQVPYVLGFVMLVNLAAFSLLYEIVSRVRKLRNDVTKVASACDVSQRLTAVGNDELFDLANNINVLLSALEDAQEYLIVAREAAEASDRTKSLLIEEIRRRDLELARARNVTETDNAR